MSEPTMPPRPENYRWTIRTEGTRTILMLTPVNNPSLPSFAKAIDPNMKAVEGAAMVLLDRWADHQRLLSMVDQSKEMDDGALVSWVDMQQAASPETRAFR